MGGLGGSPLTSSAPSPPPPTSAGAIGLGLIEIVAGEALGLALMATGCSRRRRGGCQTIANPSGISAAIKDGIDVDR